jgi:hypothetical protein
VELARELPEPDKENMLKMQGKQEFQDPRLLFRMFDFDSGVH